jgi:3-hydroxybutyryl-CoA dehydrogenase
VKYVSEVLSNLSEHYGEERYRVSPLIQRKAITGDFFYDAA